MDLDDIICHAILAAFDAAGASAAYEVADEADIPHSEVAHILETYR